MPIKRALIVDDSTPAQYRLKKMLKAYNLHIDAVDSGEAALRYLASNAPDVIFMDHLMPGMDGFRALLIIKSHPETAMSPVIMYTSKSGDVYTGQARALGALDVVSKDTINATDLGKVMKNIHIYPDSEPKPKPNTGESPELIAAANQVSEPPIDAIVSDADYPFIERRAPNQAAVDQARNLELRMSHLEHSLEDSRRFITTRVVRELQGLRQSLRQELGEIVSHAPVQAPPALPPEESIAPAEGSRNSNWLIWIALVLLAISLYYLVTIASGLSNTQKQQQDLQQAIKHLNSPTRSEPAPLSPVAPQISRGEPTVNEYAQANFLEDLSWAFNQSGTLAFAQNNLDSRAPVRVYDFIQRLLAKGFRGTVAIDLFVGDFCILLNPVGIGELAPANSNLGGCMLSSEAYNINRIQDNYRDQLTDALDNLMRDNADKIDIVIHSYPGPEAYPDRGPVTSAADWNNIAQHNNRLEIHLSPR